MSNSGAVTLADVAGKLAMLEVAFSRCERRGRLSITNLIDLAIRLLRCSAVIPECFAPSRQFTPYPWWGRRSPRLSHRVRFLILDALLLAAIGLALPLALVFAFAFFGP